MVNEQDLVVILVQGAIKSFGYAEGRAEYGHCLHARDSQHHDKDIDQHWEVCRSVEFWERSKLRVLVLRHSCRSAAGSAFLAGCVRDLCHKLVVYVQMLLK